MSYFVFIIDTDRYAGNFERQMCAHITGTIGDCGVGSNYIEDTDVLKEEHTKFDIDSLEEFFEENIYQKMDDRGCYRPCSTYETEGRSNNGNGKHFDVTDENPYQWPAYESVGIYFYNKPTDDVIEFMKERALCFVYRHKENSPKVLGFRLEEVKETIAFTKLWSEKV